VRIPAIFWNKKAGLMGRMTEGNRIIAGAMSGTSADGVDIALVRIGGRGLEMSAELIRWHSRAFGVGLRESILNIRSGRAIAISVLAEMGREISLCYAAAVNETLVAARLGAGDLTAVAAHGQTLFHEPPNTIQWFDPALVAAEVGCAVVSDFRRADCAAGGQGAPLVPLADYLLFRDPRKNRVLLNIGGIANLTYLRVGEGIDRLIAFDTGPGNCVSDYLVREADPGGSGWDENGKLAARGKPVREILDAVVVAEYFQKEPPKSTDGPAMIRLFADARVGIRGKFALEDLLHTACLITAESILESMRRFLRPGPDEIVVSGGGTANATLMGMLSREIPVKTIDELGVPSAAKEAMAFALLGAATLDGVPGNVPSATGARRAVVLGAITPRP
jgi:anhydro-N-acetylmuramic acid kinase